MVCDLWSHVTPDSTTLVSDRVNERLRISGGSPIGLRLSAGRTTVRYFLTVIMVNPPADKNIAFDGFRVDA